MNRGQRIAWLLVVIVDAGFVAWGFMAAVFPDYLLGPGGKPILAAGYEGYTAGPWPELVSSSHSDGRVHRDSVSHVRRVQPDRWCDGRCHRRHGLPTW
jgi:hypothetical protein